MPQKITKLAQELWMGWLVSMLTYIDVIMLKLLFFHNVLKLFKLIFKNVFNLDYYILNL